MKPFITSALHFEELETGRSDYLAYWVGRYRRTGAHLFQAKLKFSRGVRYLVAGSYQQPRIEQIVDQCCRYGNFSARPYQLGQPSNGSTDPCVWALYRQCCAEKGFDPTALILETYPGWEQRPDWDWSELDDQAAWEGYDSPPTWDTAALEALCISLQSIHRQVLGSALLDRVAGQESFFGE